MILGYCRVGPLESASRLEMQKRALVAIGAHMCFSEKIGLRGPFPELERAIAAADKGDTIVVTRPYRVALSARGVLDLVERLGRRGVGFRILDTPVDTSTTTGRMILGSAPRWSLGISPAQAVLRDASVMWVRRAPASDQQISRRAGQNR